jgi:urease accessory protein
MRRLSIGLLACLVPGAAAAHELGGIHDLGHGLVHPLSGLDHLVAAIAVGILAVRLGGRAMIRLPSSFAAAILAGFAFGRLGGALPLVEAGALVACASLAVAALLPRPLPAGATVGLTAIAGIWHGQAHAGAFAGTDGAWAYATGLLATTIALQVISMVVILRGRRVRAAA